MAHTLNCSIEKRELCYCGEKQNGMRNKNGVLITPHCRCMHKCSRCSQLGHRSTQCPRCDCGGPKPHLKKDHKCIRCNKRGHRDNEYPCGK